MREFLSNIKNELDFFLKNTLKFSRKNYTENNDGNIYISDNEKQREKENFLLEKYELAQYRNHISTQTYLQNIYMLDIFDTYLNLEKLDCIKILDLGAKNFIYVFAIASFFSKFAPNTKIIGVEIDANRLNTKLYSRHEIANFYTQKVNNAKYINQNFMNLKDKFDIIIWILPFIFKNPLLKWGLPLKFFTPEKMLLHAYNSLKKGGIIFIINQGEVEYEEQKRLCTNLKINYTPLGEIESYFNPFKRKFFGMIIKKC